jgi:hypothetical protein
MDDEWILFLMVWAIAEFVQYKRKKPFRSRMKTAAWWAVILGTFSFYGKAQNPSLTFFLVSLTFNGLAAALIYWPRVWIANAWTKYRGNADSF